MAAHQAPPVPGILQARTMEWWVAISFSNAWKWKVKVKSLSRVRPSATPWTAGSSVHGIFQARVLEWEDLTLSAGDLQVWEGQILRMSIFFQGSASGEVIFTDYRGYFCHPGAFRTIWGCTVLRHIYQMGPSQAFGPHLFPTTALTLTKKTCWAYSFSLICSSATLLTRSLQFHAAFLNLQVATASFRAVIRGLLASKHVMHWKLTIIVYYCLFYLFLRVMQLIKRCWISLTTREMHTQTYSEVPPHTSQNGPH